MVPLLSIIFMAVSMVISIATPFVVAAIFKKKGFGRWASFFAGMLGFVVLQLIIRIPLMQLFSTQDWYLAFSEKTVWFGLALAFTAGLFETVGRLLVFILIIPKRRTYGDGLMAGLGHGGIEAIVLAGLPMINNIVYSSMINTGTSDMLLNQVAAMPAQQQALRTAFDALINSPSPLFLAGGVERLLAITLHIALSLLVLEGIKRKQTLVYCLVAIAYHTLLDFIAVMMAFSGLNPWVMELVLLAMVVAPFIYIIVAKRRFTQLDALNPPLA